jgi:hypothetical protein
MDPRKKKIVQTEAVIERTVLTIPAPAVGHVTVLIAPAEAIPALRQQPFLQESLAFTDSDARLALERMREHVPAIVAVERLFAESDAGLALLRELRSDERLAGCQIQTVGVRRSHRYRTNEPVLLDGTPATLLDISSTGAHVLCESPLKAAQPVQIALRATALPVNATAVWVQYELPKEGPRYRAGIRFAEPAAGQVGDFISAMRR